MAQLCSHTDQIKVLKAAGDVCQDCVEQGDSWLHLRLCLTCGRVGCCDSSRNRHASAHARESGHPIVASIEPGEAWRWCYLDEVAF